MRADAKSTLKSINNLSAFYRTLFTVLTVTRFVPRQPLWLTRLVVRQDLLPTRRPKYQPLCNPRFVFLAPTIVVRFVTRYPVRVPCAVFTAPFFTTVFVRVITCADANEPNEKMTTTHTIATRIHALLINSFFTFIISFPLIAISNILS